MGQYTNKGLYNAYDKNHKERDKLDYYATPTAEVINILKELDLDFLNQTILEPCVGGGHMANGIDGYIMTKYQTPEEIESVQCIGTDIKDRGYANEEWHLEYGLDFFADDYPYDEADWIIMNPPYGVIEPFTIRALDIAKKGVIMLGRLQFLEGEGRFEKILQFNPPTDVYVYVDRIQCWKDGLKPDGSSAQAYAWFVWDRTKSNDILVEPKVHWIRRMDKK
jgi:hypothetical protein